MRLLHLSDPHLGTQQEVVCDALVNLAQRLAPDALLISGDLTQRATPSQFAAARRLLERLPRVPQLVIPGNHDIPLWNLWQRLRRPYQGYEAVAGARPHDGVSVLDLPGVRVVAADTTRWWRHRHGTLSLKQIDAVSALLRDTPAATWRLVMTHHPLSVDHPRDHEDRPWQHRRALSAWQAAGVDLLLSGHLHEPALIRVGARSWVAQAGSCVSRRLEPAVRNSVQLLVDEPVNGPGCAPGRCCLRYDYDGPRKEFMPAARQALRPSLEALAVGAAVWAA